MGGALSRRSRMRITLLPVCLAATWSPVTGTAQEEAAAARMVTVRVDPRVELMSLIFRLAGNPEYSQAKVPAYAAAADEHFAAHHEHAVVKLARELRRRHG